jgi:hypothetical protein
LRCPGCGNELSHKDLKVKRCASCRYILPVIDSASGSGSMSANMRAKGPGLPPPKRKPLTLGMGGFDDYQVGVVNAEQMPDEPFVSNEPSITTYQPDLVLPKPPNSPNSPRKPRRVRKPRYDKTIKVTMLPPPEEGMRDKSRFWTEIGLISIIILCTLAITAVIIFYLQ